MIRQSISGLLQVRFRLFCAMRKTKLKYGWEFVRDVALAGASATIASDALMNPFDGEYFPILILFQ